MATGEAARRHGFYIEIFLVALAVVLLEISHTRIFSFKVFYYFTYLIIGLALLGLGSGGVLIAISHRLRDLSAERSVPLTCLLASLAVPLSYLTIAEVQLNVSQLSQNPALELGKLGAICIAMFVPFLLGGIAIAAIFVARPERIPRLYFADLVGAGLGCALVVFLLRALTPPGTVLLCGALFALAAIPLARRTGRAMVGAAVVLAIANASAGLIPGVLPDPLPDQIKNMAPSRMGVGVDHLHSQWDPVFRVDVIAASEGPMAGLHFLSHDGVVGSSVTQYDGNPASLQFFDGTSRALPFGVLGGTPAVLIIGAAGGREVAAAIHFGASEILAVELNPVTVSLMTGKFADFSGRIMFDERVTLVNAEGRNFVSQLDRPVDLIWLVAPDSYAAMNAATAGAFVLSESYLYTTEMMEEALSRLSDDGILCAQFGDRDFGKKPKRTSRYLTTARQALQRMGMHDFPKHVLVATSPDFPWPSSTILLKRTPFTPAEVERFRAGVDALDAAVAKKADGHAAGPTKNYRERAIVWHAGAGPEDLTNAHPVNQVISLGNEELDQWLAEFEYDVTPIDDDAPFFYHFIRLPDVVSEMVSGTRPSGDLEESLGERVLLILFAFSVLFAAVMILLPFVAIRETWKRLPFKINVFLYFAALGLGFMFFEVSLIQKLTLFVGYPTYSLSVTLFAILLSTAVGSLASERYWNGERRVLVGLFGVLCVLAVFYRFGLSPLIDALSALPLAMRIVIAALVTLPLGVSLGAFMPIGLATVAKLTDHRDEMIAWSWAVNGFTSVVGSTLATILSMSIGFNGVQAVAVVVYGIGILALRALPTLR